MAVTRTTLKYEVARTYRLQGVANMGLGDTGSRTTGLEGLIYVKFVLKKAYIMRNVDLTGSF